MSAEQGPRVRGCEGHECLCTADSAVDIVLADGVEAVR